MSVNENNYYSELDGGYTVYQGTPKLNSAAKKKVKHLGNELQNPGRGSEFSSFSSPLNQNNYSMNPTDKSQRYGMDPKSDGFQSSSDSEKPMPGSKSGTPEKGIMYLLSGYADKCSMNGVIFIKSSKYLIVKAIWAVLLVGALTVMVLHLYELASKYYSYEKQSQIDLKFSKLPFPAVTFCNVNPMKLSKAHLASDKLQKLIKSVNPDEMYKNVDNWNPKYEDEVYHFDENGDPAGEGPKERKRRAASKVTVKSRTNNFLDDYNFTDYDETYVDEYEERNTFSGSWESESEPAAFDKITKQFINLYNKETAPTRQEMGHRIQDMLVQCSYAGRKCLQQNFTLVSSSTMGNCFTIQYSKFTARQSGPSYGLSMMLYLEPDEYISGVTNALGLKLVVHESDTVPFPDDEGVAIAAGMETNVALKRISVTRLGDPFGACSNVNTFNSTYGIKYTRQSCQQICEMEEIISSCGCFDATKPFIFTLLKTRVGAKPCQSLNKEKVWCMKDIKWNFDSNESTCHCFSPCEETTYSKTLSSKPWPSTPFAKLIAKSVCKDKNRTDICDYARKPPMELRENFAKINVYFETLNYQSLSEQEDYTEFQFISDIGGTVGLYVGLSVLSMFEIFHLLIAMSRYLICGNWRKKSE